MIDAEKAWLEKGMTPETALRWLIELGTDWVDVDTLFDTWADTEMNWNYCVNTQGTLEESGEGFTDYNINFDGLRLTQKAIDLIKNHKGEQRE